MFFSCFICVYMAMRGPTPPCVMLPFKLSVAAATSWSNKAGLAVCWLFLSLKHTLNKNMKCWNIPIANLLLSAHYSLSSLNTRELFAAFAST